MIGQEETLLLQSEIERRLAKLTKSWERVIFVRSLLSGLSLIPLSVKSHLDGQPVVSFETSASLAVFDHS